MRYRRRFRRRAADEKRWRQETERQELMQITLALISAGYHRNVVATARRIHASIGVPPLDVGA